MFPELVLWYLGSVYIEQYHFMQAHRDMPMSRILRRPPPRLFLAPLVSCQTLPDGRYAAVSRATTTQDSEVAPLLPYRLLGWSPDMSALFLRPARSMQ